MRRLSIPAILLAFCLPGPAAAQSGATVDHSAVEACFASASAADPLPHCIGSAAATCTAATPGTTLDISNCLQAETAAWDAILNREYGAARAVLSARGASGDGASLTEALRTAQRAWIAFRDADCGLSYAIWGGGSFRVIAAGNCYLTKTAQRAIELREIKGE